MAGMPVASSGLQKEFYNLLRRAGEGEHELLLQLRHLLSFILGLYIQWHSYSGNPDLASCLSFKQFNLYSRWQSEHVHEITPMSCHLLTASHPL